jgi:hypothetical protein
MNSKALDAFHVPKDVYAAIRKAADRTGVNFTYLLEKAAVESGFDKNAKARTSSATGLYQFIESTWLRMVKDHGGKYGLEKFASKISEDGRVASRQDRNTILNLRKDPQVASYMAAEFAAGNYDTLKERVGGDVGATELYMAHFLGAGGASAFLNAMKKSPNMVAADIFPREARANRNVFFDSKTGTPRTMKGVYAFFDQKFNHGGADQSQTIVANANTISPLRAQGYTGPKSPQAFADAAPDSLSRLSSLLEVMQAQGAQNSLLRLTSSEDGAGSSDDLRILPPSLYGKLALSPAQMMLLSDFSA